MDYNEITLLSKDQVFGKNQIDVIKKMGTKCAVTDFAILLGVNYSYRSYIKWDTSDRGRTGEYYLLTPKMIGDVSIVETYGVIGKTWASDRYVAIRPVISVSDISSFLSKGFRGNTGLIEVEYGEYPQYVVEDDLRLLLDKAYEGNMMRLTGKKYFVDKESCKLDLFEYEYKGKRYVCMYFNGMYGNILSDGKYYGSNVCVWLEVSPIKWIVDEKAKLLVSKNLLASGVRFCDDNKYFGNFKKTEMYTFLNTNFAKDIIPSKIKEISLEENKQLNVEQKSLPLKRNPYGLNLEQVSEEDIIKGAIESGVAVFLHGPSSEGKSARVKQIDPDCVIIYLRNATPESLNGKSVYNSETGEMIDIKPSWLKKIEAKCESEPNRMHIVFFDEITNALPSIQGIAFNIVLDREVNGIWKLPDNARIVAAGNDMKDSLAANQLAEPLFNRFAHVYIKTTTESWLKWASKNNIHPAIYSYIAYTNGKSLRSEYNGETPNADPRKWEMASKMLYTTKNPEMLRALVGEDITKEFVEFCNQQVITLQDVINDNYTDADIESLNIAQRYATTMGLSQVDEVHLNKVRSFVTKLGGEFSAIFDILWIQGDDSKLEKLAEENLVKIKKKN